MDDDGSKSIHGGGSDRISSLPDSLLCEILVNLRTKDAVKTSVLSSRWTSIWKDVPRLDLRFVYGTYSDEPEDCLVDIRRLMDCLFDLKVQNVNVSDLSEDSWKLEMPITLYTCESLVSFRKALPCLKLIDLDEVKFSDDLVLETLISSCPVLETLLVERYFYDDIVQVLRVSSQSLLRFTHVVNDYEADEHLVVEIDAPKLAYLKLEDAAFRSYVMKNIASLVKADIDTEFNLAAGKKFDPNNLPLRDMIRNFLNGISSVKDLRISWRTLEVIYDYSRCEPLPLFRNLSVLRVELCGPMMGEMLPIFLEMCPNLKSLVVGYNPGIKGINILYGPRCLLPSLQYVEIKSTLKAEEVEMKLVRYFLDNSKILKKLTLCLDDSKKNEVSVIFKELLTIPRLSTLCQVVVLR